MDLVQNYHPKEITNKESKMSGGRFRTNIDLRNLKEDQPTDTANDDIEVSPPQSVDRNVEIEIESVGTFKEIDDTAVIHS
jgi:hypothetical protein